MVLVRRLAPLLLLGWVAGGATALAGQGQRDLLVGVARMAAAGPARTAGIWPGFAVPTEFILCGRTGLTLAVASALPDSVSRGSDVVERLDVGGVLLSGPPPGLDPVCFDLSYSWGASNLLAVPLILESYGITDPITANLSQLYHEAFHQFQEASFAATREGGYSVFEEVRIPLAVINSPKFGQVAEQERVLLASALGEPDPALRWASIERYIRLREERSELLPLDVRQAEAHHERKEGTANLVGLAAAFAVVGPGEGAVRRAVVDDLENTPPFAGRRYMSHPYRRWHVYATGAALGILLDDLGVAWRGRVADGATPYALLAELIPEPPTKE